MATFPFNNPDYKLNMNIISTDRSLNTLIVTI